MARRGLVGRVLRSPMNPMWTGGQGLRQGSDMLTGAMPTVSRMGDQVLNSPEVASALTTAGNAAGSASGDVIAHGLTLLSDFIEPAALGDLSATIGGGIGSLFGPAGTATGAGIGKAIGTGVGSMSAPVKHAAAFGATKIPALATALGGAAAVPAAKIAGRAAMGVPAAGMQGMGNMMSLGPENPEYDRALMMRSALMSAPQAGMGGNVPPSPAMAGPTGTVKDYASAMFGTGFMDRGMQNAQEQYGSGFQSWGNRQVESPMLPDGNMANAAQIAGLGMTDALRDGLAGNRPGQGRPRHQQRPAPSSPAPVEGVPEYLARPPETQPMASGPQFRGAGASGGWDDPAPSSPVPQNPRYNYGQSMTSTYSDGSGVTAGSWRPGSGSDEATAARMAMSEGIGNLPSRPGSGQRRFVSQQELARQQQFQNPGAYEEDPQRLAETNATVNDARLRASRPQGPMPGSPVNDMAEDDRRRKLMQMALGAGRR